MKMRVIGAAAVAGLVLLPGTAPAQQRGVARGPAAFTSPRPKPAAETPQPAGDLFRARPWTYKPRYDRVPHGRFPRHLFFPDSFGFAMPVYAPSPPWPVSGAGSERETRDDASTVYVRPPADPQPLEPYAPGVPGPAKTLYVVPGCYAGDVPPRPGQLPDGCNVADVRAVAPRPR